MFSALSPVVLFIPIVGESRLSLIHLVALNLFHLVTGHSKCETMLPHVGRSLTHKLQIRLRNSRHPQLVQILLRLAHDQSAGTFDLSRSLIKIIIILRLGLICSCGHTFSFHVEQV